MGSIQETPRNTFIGGLADLLQSGKSYANQYEILPQIPLVGGTGLGDMFMGKAPELINDISYDGLQAAIRGGNSATGGIGTYGARPAVADAALLGMDVAGISKGLGSLSRKSASALYDKLLEGGTSVSRRDALKKLGAFAGGAAMTGTGVGALRKLTDNVVVEAAPKVMDNVAVTAAKKYKYNSLAEYMATIKNQVSRDMDNTHGQGWQMESPDHTFELDNAMQSRMLADESAYNIHKSSQRAYGNSKRQLNQLQTKLRDRAKTYLETNSFSPQAKQEFKDWKAGVEKLNTDYGTPTTRSNNWAHWMTNASDDPDATLKFLRDYAAKSQGGSNGL